MKLVRCPRESHRATGGAQRTRTILSKAAIRAQDWGGTNTCARSRRALGSLCAYSSCFTLCHRPANAVYHHRLSVGDGRSAAALCLAAKPPHDGAGALGHRLSVRRFGSGVARIARAAAELVVGLHCQRVHVRRVRHDVGRRALVRRAARPYPPDWTRRGDLDCRISVRELCRLAAGTRAAGIGDHGRLCALECPRALVCARSRTDLTLADTGTHCHPRRLSAGAHTVRGYVGDRNRHRSPARHDRHGGGFPGAVYNVLPAVPARRHVEGTGGTGAEAGGADRFADRRRQSPRLLRSRRAAARRRVRRSPLRRAVVVRSRSFQGRQRYRRTSGRRPRAQGVSAN